MKVDNIRNQPFPHPGGSCPFTPAVVRDLINEHGVLRGSQKPLNSASLKRLSFALNDIEGLFAYQTLVLSRTRDTASAVKPAILTLIAFFEARRAELARIDLEKGGELLERERRLSDAFHHFLEAMQAHEFNLDIDVSVGPQMVASWHDAATPTALEFAIAMRESNPETTVGMSSNTGPIPRFVTAAIPLITGETPTLEAVSQHLKRAERKRRQDRDSEVGRCP